MKNISSKLVSRLAIIATLASAPMITTIQATYAASPQHESASPHQVVNPLPGAESSISQIIIKYKPGVAVIPDSSVQMSALQTAAGVGMTYARSMSGDAHVMRLGAAVSQSAATTIASRIAAVSGIESAQPDYPYQAAFIPDDSLFSQQWHYFTPTVGTYGINLPAAWDVTRGISSVVVAVLDTGHLPHADLAGQTVPGYDFITNVTTAGDGDGHDSDPTDPGDFATCSGVSRNSTWHGTHVAGTIGAASNNALGVAGVSHGSKIMPVRVLGKCGGFSSDIADAIRWSSGLPVSGVPNNPTPAKVINMSLGGSSSCSSDVVMQSAINAATAAGTIVVVAAGNSNANASGFSPASCNNAIAVAATGRTGSKASYSNFGSIVKISAPGGDSGGGVLSTLNSGSTTAVADSYASYQGTSMATPHVAGVVALMLSLRPTMNYTKVLSVLQSTATAFPSGSTCNTSNCGAGIVNAYGALQQSGDMMFGFSNGTGTLGSTGNIIRVSTQSPFGDLTGVAGIQFNFAYPDNMGIIMNNIRTTSRTSGYTILSNTVQSGGVFSTSVLLYSASAAAISAGNGPVLEILVNVSASPTATAGTTVPVTLSNVLLANASGNPIQTQITTTNPVFNITSLRRGDINSDVNANVLDLTILRNMILSSPQPNPSYAADWWTRGDLNSDSTWNILDMIIEVRLVMGLPTAATAKQADGNSERITSSTNANKVSLTTVNAMPGTSGSMKVHLSNETNIAGLQLNLAYDATRGLKLTNVRRVGRSGEAGTTAWAVSDENSAQAKLTALWYGVNGETLSAGDGDMLLIDYEVAANATGPISVDISQAILAGERADALPIQVESGKVIVGGNAANVLPSAER